MRVSEVSREQEIGAWPPLDLARATVTMDTRALDSILGQMLLQMVMSGVALPWMTFTRAVGGPMYARGVLGSLVVEAPADDHATATFTLVGLHEAQPKPTADDVTHLDPTRNLPPGRARVAVTFAPAGAPAVPLTDVADLTLDLGVRIGHVGGSLRAVSRAASLALSMPPLHVPVHGPDIFRIVLTPQVTLRAKAYLVDQCEEQHVWKFAECALVS